VGVVAGADGLLRLNSTTGGRSGDSHYLFNISRLTYDGYRQYSDARNLQLNGTVGTTALGGDLRVVGSFVDYDANNPGSLNQTQLDADRFQAAPANLTHQTGEDGQQGQLGLSWRGAMGPGQLEFAGYGLTREIFNPIPFNTIQIDRKAGGVHLLYRSSDEPVTSGFGWGIGAEGDLQSDDRTVFPHSGAGVRSDTPSQAQDEKVLGGALFAQLSAVPMPRLTALAGLRYDITSFEAEDRLITETNPDDSGERTMNAFSPSIGLSYELFDRSSLYGNIATSFETPTATELANQEDGSGGFNPVLDPQRTISYEVGLKGVVAGGRAGYQLSAYRANIEDALVPFTAPNERTYYRNAGSAVHQGVELGLSVVPADPINVDIAYTWVDARFDEYTVGGVSLEDNRIPGVSPHRLDASLTVQAPYGLFVTADARYTDLMPVNDANTANAPAYTLVDLRAGLDEFSFGGFTLEPFVGVTNVFDEEYVTSPSVNHAAGRFFESGPGRAAYVGGQIRFDVR
jgi:iron complex outermembrane receptor protein